MTEEPLRIYRYGEPLLKQPTELVKLVDDDVMRTASRMSRAMRQVGGVGISAPQIGSSLCMSLVSGLNGLAPDPAKDSVLLINPELVWHGDEKLTQPEGCLSIDAARWFTSVSRWRRVKVRYQDAAMKEQTWTAEGYVARILQHELDHLSGKMISDGLTRQQRRAIERIVKAPAPKPAPAAKPLLKDEIERLQERQMREQQMRESAVIIHR